MSTNSENTDFTEAELSELRALFPHPDLKILSLDRLTRAGMDCDAIATISYVERRANQRRFRVHRVIAFFYRPQHAPIPAFSLAPSDWLSGGVFRIAAQLTGIPRVDLPAYPDVANKYAILSFQPHSTQQLFNRHLLDTIAALPRCQINTGNQSIAVGASRETVSDLGVESFIESAVAIAHRILESARNLPAPATSPAQEMQATVDSMDGWIGERLRDNILPPANIESFLNQTPPRQPARSIRRRAYGSKPFLTVWSGLFGSAPIALALILHQAPGNRSAVLPILLLLFALIPLAIMVRCAGTWWRLRHILRNGEVVQARVANIKVTGIESDNDRLHDITFESAAGASQTRMGRQPAAQARQLLDAGTSTRILIDRSHPDLCIWLNGWS